MTVHYNYKMVVWRLNCEDKKSTDFFSLPFLVWLALLLKMASSPSYLPAASPPPSSSSPALFRLFPPLPPRQMRDSPGLRLASLHPIRIACRACDVTYMFDLSYAWTDMWTGCGGVSKGGNGGGAVCPNAKATVCWSHSSCTETQTEIIQCERDTEKLSLSPTHQKFRTRDAFGLSI